MILNLKYFGQIAEITSCNQEELEFSGNTISEIKELLFNKYPSLQGKDFTIAQNQEIVSLETKVTGKEIALLPPFSGG
jgi:molybdopterin synthase sulfur carrier subunit